MDSLTTHYLARELDALWRGRRVVSASITSDPRCVVLHVEGRERVQPGTFVRAGDRIGHASCEGGFSTGTHLHLARRYNGEWIPADADLPFNLDGWVSEGDGSGYEYNGYLVNNGSVVEAWEGRRDENQISR